MICLLLGFVTTAVMISWEYDLLVNLLEHGLFLFASRNVKSNTQCTPEIINNERRMPAQQFFLVSTDQEFHFMTVGTVQDGCAWS
jgi:hypothetical protein